MNLDDAQAPYKELFDLVSEGVLIAANDGKVVEVNRAACDLLGYEPEQLIGKMMTDLVVRDGPTLAGAPKQQLMRHSSGTHLTVEVTSRVLSDGRWAAFMLDIRDRSMISAARRLCEQRFRVALHGTPVMVYTQDRDLRYTWVFNLTPPFSEETTIGRHQSEVLPRDYANELDGFKRTVLATGIPGHKVVAMDYANGRHWYDVSVEPIRDDAGQITGLTGAALDITERKRAEDEQALLSKASSILLRLSTDWQQLLEHSTELALELPADFCLCDVIDDDERVIRLHAAVADPAKASAARALEQLPFDQSRPHLATDALKLRQPHIVEHVTPEYLDRVTQSPEHRAIVESFGFTSLLQIPITSRGQLLGAYVFGSTTRTFDHHDLRIATTLATRVGIGVDNARLYRAAERAVQARDQVLAIVAHDLRNPLQSVRLVSDLLGHMVAEGPATHAVDRLRNSVQRASRLVQDLVDVVRLDARKALLIAPCEVSPDRLAQDALDALEPIANASKVQLELAMDTDLPSVNADPVRVMQVFDNLIGNAVKFSPQGSVVSLRVTNQSDRVRFTIADQGPGILPEQKQHIFDPFWQADKADRRGIGLGLYVAKGIVDAHHGKIWCESEPGHGTAFHFELLTRDESHASV